MMQRKLCKKDQMLSSRHIFLSLLHLEKKKRTNHLNSYHDVLCFNLILAKIICIYGSLAILEAVKVLLFFFTLKTFEQICKQISVKKKKSINRNIDNYAINECLVHS